MNLRSIRPERSALPRLSYIPIDLIRDGATPSLRKAERANAGVRTFFRRAADGNLALYLSAITIGELRQGIENIRHRGDRDQAGRLEHWLDRVNREFTDSIPAFDADMAQVWGRLRAPSPENPLDKQIAATALIHDLTVVTRNTAHYSATGVQILNPFD